MSKKIEIELTVPYPIDIVWRALTLPEAITQWCMETDFKPEAGTKFQFRGTPNKFWRGFVDCEIKQIVPPRLLQFTMQNTPGQTPTLKTYTLKEVEGCTNIQVTDDGYDKSHGLFSGLFIRTMIKTGMKKELFTWLPQVLENGKNGNFGKKINR